MTSTYTSPTFSAPIYILKQQARVLSRRESLPLHEALDRIAQREGYTAWSHLAARSQADDGTAAVYARLQPGELLLLASRPGQGKTLLAAGLAIEALTRGHGAAFFSLEETVAGVARCFARQGRRIEAFGSRLVIDCSDRICADHIAERLAAVPPGTLVVVDYLQLLDQPRERPPVAQQVARLRAFAEARGAIIVCLSQVRRDFEPSGARPCPGLADVRLPNPLDLALFTKACFLHDGRLQVQG